MYIDSRVEFGASLVKINDSFNWEWAVALCSIKCEVPTLAAGSFTFQAQGTNEQYSESTVHAYLGECAFLKKDTNIHKDKKHFCAVAFTFNYNR